MPTFRYVAKDKGGKTITGEAEAPERTVLIDTLRKEGLVIISISEKKKRALFEKKSVKLDELVIFSRQLATIVDAGIPLVGALDILGQQTENKAFKQIILRARDDIETGSSLSTALSKHPKIFSKLFVSMVVAGEGSGTLDTILERVATYMEKTASLQRKVKSAMVYPAVVCSMAILITVVLLVKVVPTFKDIYAGFGAKLPLPTMILLGISECLQRFILWVIGALGLLIYFLKRYTKTEKGSFKADQLKLKLPIFGKLLRKVAIARFTRTLSTLTQSGVAILSALEIVAKTSGNRVVEQAILKARSSVREGETIAEPLTKSGVFPPLVTRMISVGEKAGELEKMLAKIADFYDEQVDTAVSGLTSMIEPLVIAFLGVMIGSIVIAMFMPIFKITEIIGM